MRLLFIINRHAGKENKYQLIEEQLKGYDCEVRYTERSGHATQLAGSFVQESDEFALIFVCGGDGTLNEVISGVYDLKNCSVAPVPTGSGNDFIRSLSPDPEAFFNVKDLINGYDIEIDLLKCNDSICDNSVTIGFDCAVAKNVEKFKKKRFISPSLAYKLSIFYCLIKERRHSFRVIADGSEVEHNGTYLLSVCAKGKYYGGGIKCAPKAEFDDGMIDFMYIYTVGVLKFISLLPTFTKGNHIDNPKTPFIFHDKKSEIIYKADKPFEIGIDGEISTVDEARITVLKKAQKIRLPRIRT